MLNKLRAWWENSLFCSSIKDTTFICSLFWDRTRSNLVIFIIEVLKKVHTKFGIFPAIKNFNCSFSSGVSKRWIYHSSTKLQFSPALFFFRSLKMWDNTPLPPSSTIFSSTHLLQLLDLEQTLMVILICHLTLWWIWWSYTIICCQPV